MEKCSLRNAVGPHAGSAAIAENCPSYCLGEQPVIVEEPLVLGVFGPIVPKVALVCVEESEPQIQYVPTLRGLYRALVEFKNQ